MNRDDIIRMVRKTDLMQTLDPRSRRIIEARWLCDDVEKCLTLRDLSIEFGVSAERIRQIEAKTLRKLNRLMYEQQGKEISRDDIIRTARKAGLSTAWFSDNGVLRWTDLGRFAALVAAQRQWVELTDDEARALVNRATFGDRTNWQALVYMIDAKLKEKNAA
jgi:DNA-directed RNA polymerase sigma subunit (sigma70/sigma32)